jgi:RNA polymerase sigma-70 factor (ECF subfamily)
MQLDTDALADIDTHMPRLHGIARRFLGSDDLAWDAVQDALLCLCEEPAEPRDVRGWLVRAVVHKSLHHARSRARRRRHEGLAASFRVAMTERETPAGDLVLADLRACVDNAIALLPRPMRDVVRLHAFDELDYAEIARRLALPIGTVRSRLSRARALLRGQLAGFTHDERLCLLCVRGRRDARVG